MRIEKIVLSVLALAGVVDAFSSSVLPKTRVSSTTVHGYVPSGLTKEQWEKIKKKEAEQKKNLGRVGPRGFKSRSMQSFQEALERGEAEHLLPVFNAKERIAKGELKLEDIPYMQRGGAWVSSNYNSNRSTVLPFESLLLILTKLLLAAGQQ